MREKTILFVGEDFEDSYKDILLRHGYTLISLYNFEAARRFLLTSGELPQTVFIADESDGHFGGRDLLHVLHCKYIIGYSPFSRSLRVGFCSNDNEPDSLKKKVEDLGVKYFQRYTTDPITILAYTEGIIR